MIDWQVAYNHSLSNLKAWTGLTIYESYWAQHCDLEKDVPYQEMLSRVKECAAFDADTRIANEGLVARNTQPTSPNMLIQNG